MKLQGDQVRYRMERPCPDCPFSKSPAGRHLRQSLRPGRLAEIKAALRRGEYFLCHQTTRETGDGSNLLCAGALDYQHRRGVESNYERVCARLLGLT